MEASQKRKLTNAAVIVMSSIIVSRISGFFREMLIPNMLSPGEADAYIMAFKITDLMYNLLVGGAIAAALIPVLSGYIEKKDEEEGWKAVGTFVNIIFLAMSVICILGMIFAPWLVPIIAYGFNSESTDLTIRLTRILFPSVSFIMLAGLTNGILNSYSRFAASAYGPTLYNIGGALSLLILSRFGVEKVAYGVMFSALLYFLFQLSFAAKNLKRYRFKIYPKHPGFIKLFRLAIPSLVSSSIVQINVLVSAMFVTLFGNGSVNAFNMADKTWQMPYGIFAQGIGIAMLPALSSRFAAHDMEGYKKIFIKSLKTVLLLSIPSAIGLIILRESVIKTIFQWSSKFNQNLIPMAGSILMFFSIALLTQSTVATANRAFYAVNDTKSPLFVGAGTILVNLGLSWFFYRYTSLGVAGMAFSYSITSTLNAVLLLSILNRKMNGVYIKKLVIFLFKVIPASVAMGMILFVTSRFADFSTSPKPIQLVYLSLQIITGVLIYFIIVIVARVEEAIYVWETVRSKIKIINTKIMKNFSR